MIVEIRDIVATWQNTETPYEAVIINLAMLPDFVPNRDWRFQHFLTMRMYPDRLRAYFIDNGVPELNLNAQGPTEEILEASAAADIPDSSMIELFWQMKRAAPLLNRAAIAAEIWGDPTMRALMMVPGWSLGSSASLSLAPQGSFMMYRDDAADYPHIKQSYPGFVPMIEAPLFPWAPGVNGYMKKSDILAVNREFERIRPTLAGPMHAMVQLHEDICAATGWMTALEPRDES